MKINIDKDSCQKRKYILTSPHWLPSEGQSAISITEVTAIYVDIHAQTQTYIHTSHAQSHYKIFHPTLHLFSHNLV